MTPQHNPQPKWRIERTQKKPGDIEMTSQGFVIIERQRTIDAGFRVAG